MPLVDSRIVQGYVSWLVRKAWEQALCKYSEDQPWDDLKPARKKLLFNDYHEIVAKYSEDQPRDDSGKWTSSGASTAERDKEGKWRDAKTGETLPDHLQACGIKPGWHDVRYNPDPKGSIYVVAKDKAGRSQYIYSKEAVQAGQDAKWERVVELDSKYDDIWASVDKDIKSGTRVEEASAMRLVMATGIRSGSDKETFAKVKAYGATTLEGRHVVETKDGVSLNFVGKEGKSLSIPVEDRAVARDLLTRKAEAGDNGRLFGTNREKLLDYSYSRDGGGLKVKDFRTLVGTRTAVDKMTQIVCPTSPAAYRKAVGEVAKAVATKLGNTPPVALTSYIHPAVFGIWRINSGV